MDNSFLKPGEVPTPIESSEQIEMQELNDTTFEPGAYLEQRGDLQESEAIQTSLTEMMDSISNIAAEEIQIQGISPSEVSSSPVPQPVPEPTGGISTQPGDQIEDLHGPMPQPAGKSIGSEVVEDDMVSSNRPEAVVQKPSAAEDILDAGTSQIKETINVGEIPSPGSMAETIGGRSINLESTSLTGRLVGNTLSGLEDKVMFKQTYQAQEVTAGEAKLFDAAVSILRGDLVMPEVTRITTPEAGEVPPSPEGEGTSEGAEPPPAGGEQGETTEPEGETGEEWTPPEMYIYRDAEGNITVVDANGKPIDSPPSIKTIGETTYAYYPDHLGEDGTPIKFEIDAFKGSDTDLFYYVDSQGKIIVVDANGKPLDCQPMISSPSGEPPYYATYPGAYDENGNLIKVELNCYLGPRENVSYRPEIIDVSYINGVRVGYYADGVFYSNLAPPEWQPPENYRTMNTNFYCFMDKDGNLIAVDSKGEPIDSPPKIVYNPEGNPPYYAYYQGAVDDLGNKLVDENGHELKIPVYFYPGSTEEIFFYRDSQGNLTVVDANGKPVDSPPNVVGTPDGNPPYSAFYPEVYDEDGNLAKFEVQQYKGISEDMYFYRDSQGNLTVVDANGKPVDSPPKIIQSPDGFPPFTAFYPGVYDEDGNLVKIEIQQYKGTSEDIYYYRDSQGNLTVVDANGKPVDSPPKMVQSLDGFPPFTAFYPEVYDEDGNLVKFDIQPYPPPSAPQSTDEK